MTLTTVNPALLDTQAQYTGFKNRIINGAMVIDQRNAGAALTINNAAALQYSVDRFYGYGQTSDGVFTLQQDSSVPTGQGFTYSLKATVTTADASIGATQLYVIGQRIEGYNVADFGLGTASAVTFTFSFWTRSSLTGTFGGALQNGGQNRSYPFSYTISVANTWEKKTVTLTGDTSGTWLTTNGTGLELIWGLGVGSTFLGTANAWAGSALSGVTGQTQVIATSGATFYITGVQLEKGSTATSFDYRPYGTELALCQRYFWKWNGTPSRKWVFSGMILSTTVSYGVFHTKQTMRAQPTMGTSGTAGDYCLYQGNSLIVCNDVPAISASDVDTPTFEFRGTGMTDGRASLNGSNNDNGFITLSAEL